MRLAERVAERVAGQAEKSAFDFDARNEIARGYMLLGVFFVHTLIDMAANPDPARSQLALIKILGPQVSMFFFLSGMSSRGIGKRSLHAVAQQSVMLIALAWISHIIGYIAEDLIYGGDGGPRSFMTGLLTPLITGTGGVTYVTWFFTTLAAVRVLVWVFERDKRGFVLVWVAIIGLVYVASALKLPDNLYEWRHWPFATLFMLIGMHLPKNWRVPAWLGMAAFAAAIALTWVNAPDLLQRGPCLLCNLDFSAGADITDCGFMPVYIAAECLFFIGLLWGAQLAHRRLVTRISRYFGGASLQFLLLHGWFLTTLEPAATYLFILPDHWLIVAAFILDPLVHAGLFWIIQGWLNRILSFCFKLGRGVVDLCRVPAKRAALEVK